MSDAAAAALNAESAAEGPTCERRLVPGSFLAAFCVADMQLALPVEAMVEAVPCPAIQALPTGRAYVLGAVDVRGIPVPVLDLRALLGLAPAADALRRIVIVRAGAQRFGMAAETVGGIFRVPQDGIYPASPRGEDIDRLILASVRPQGGAATLTVLDEHALARMPGLPAIPAQAFSLRSGSARGAEGGERESEASLVLFRRGAIAYAIPTHCVHAVHARPAVEAGPLTGAACHGIVRQQAQTLALVDPGALLSLGQKGAAPAYAVVLREERPAIAFSADEIWEIARLPHEQIRTVPAQTIGAGGLRGVLAPADLAGAAPADWTAPVLLLDCATLMAHPLLESLGQACRSAGLRDDALAGNATGARKQDAGVVYWAGAELASPMLQVQRVLTYTPADTLVRREGARMGVLLHAGEAITLYDLGTLLGRPGCPEPQAGAPVMVIRSAGQAIGLVVGELRELGMLRPLPQGPSRRFFAQPDALSPALRMGLSMTGEGAAKRAVLTLDLENTAAQLLAA